VALSKGMGDSIHPHGNILARRTAVPWDTEQPLHHERADFIELVLSAACPFARACADFGVSRKTGYKWLARASAPRPQPLRDRTRRPRHSPGRTPPAVERAILDAHACHPWGARKLHAFLCRGDGPVPSRGTVHNVLARHGLAGPAAPKPPPQRFERRAANDLWQMDFKGPLPGWPQPRYLFSVIDDHSRYLLAVRLCRDMTMATAWAALWALFGTAGVPCAILSDNAFGSRGHGSSCPSWLEARLERLGVLHPHGRPGHPQTQGKVERYHRTLGREALGRLTPGRPDEEAQAALDGWRAEYNGVRPHDALGGGVPAGRWAPSERPRPLGLPAVKHPAGSEVRRVQARGEISWRGFELALGQGLAGEEVGLIEADGRLAVWYGTRRLRVIPVDALAKGRTN
jgi:transposase InsO family protein